MAVDASVALKWVLPEEQEPHAQQAQGLLLRASENRDRVIVPPHFFAEVLNVIHRRTLRQNPMPAPEAAAALGVILRLPLDLHAFDGLYGRAFALAQAHQLPSACDALYVAVAESAGCDLWTDDRRLLRALDGQLPYVRWIGDWR